MQSNNKKICIVASSLGSGGAERSSAQLSFILDHLNYDVFIVTVLNKVNYVYKGTLFNLGALKQKEDTTIGRLKRLQCFSSFLKTHNFDVIIDARTRVQAYREFIITNFIYRHQKVVYVLHNYKTAKTFTPYRSLNKWLYTHAQMVTVSQEANTNFKKTLNLKYVDTIYNAFNFSDLEKAAKTLNRADLGLEDYIIFYGRLDDYHKNIKLLITAFKQSELPSKGIKLLILGDGPDVEMLKTFVVEQALVSDIVFKGFVANPYPYVKHAMFSVLTSRFEGFPMVIPESLGLGTPVIAVDCKSGPKEVISTGYNGILVEKYTAKAIAEAMNSFIFDKTLYDNCKHHAKASVQQFSIEKITNDWKTLLDKI